MDLNEFLSSTVVSLANVTNKLDKNLHSSNSNLKDSFINDLDRLCEEYKRGSISNI